MLDPSRQPRIIDRRRFLQQGSLGSLALSLLLAGQQPGRAADPIKPQYSPEKPHAPRKPHFKPAAEQVLVIFCSGALSHIDSWDYKPELIKRHDQPLPGGDGLVTFQGAQGNLVQPLWPFKPRGDSGKMISDLLPNLAELADDLSFIHSMTAKSNTHGPAENQLSTGFVLDGFPSMGAWVSYALGSEAEDLPSFVAIPDPRGVPQVGPNHWNSAFLPAMFQGTPFNADKPIPNLATPSQITPSMERATRDLLKTLNEKHLEKHPRDVELSSRIASYELAARMQLGAAEAGDLSKETAATHRDYGLEDSNQLKARFGKNCLLARRLIERGVRFVQLFNGSYAMGEGVGNWDGHKTLKTQYDIHRQILDQPAAALIKDLRQRGLLEKTVVAFVTEFGRMPTFQKGASGRDHNPQGFTVWLTGAGVKRGTTYGSTDEFGYKAVENVATIYDLHATLLHLLGIDHERLSFYHNGIDRRLTDVHGHVIKGILA
ncbi:DUF1501 domain-containing protein [Anatilimnocola floriformis]|uniref:DUF1501 domain-containing protein n=1 Tax=Anatilimnocola floriformis TaxID=2948575 RepID=UPI0020C37188|nr:DUF1501 domain-containing protein [Anatilimnocola floriformis]